MAHVIPVTSCKLTISPGWNQCFDSILEPSSSSGSITEQRTVGQYTCSEWECLRRNRFTASMSIQFKENKTERGIPTLAKLFSSPSKGKDVTNAIVHEKLKPGKIL